MALLNILRYPDPRLHKVAKPVTEFGVHLDQLAALGFPVLYGASRKRTIQTIDPSATDPMDRLGGSLALALEAARRGAAIVRVHDVRETVQALALQAAVRAAGAGTPA